MQHPGCVVDLEDRWKIKQAFTQTQKGEIIRTSIMDRRPLHYGSSCNTVPINNRGISVNPCWIKSNQIAFIITSPTAHVPWWVEFWEVVFEDTGRRSAFYSAELRSESQSTEGFTSIPCEMMCVCTCNSVLTHNSGQSQISSTEKVARNH